MRPAGRIVGGNEPEEVSRMRIGLVTLVVVIILLFLIF